MDSDSQPQQGFYPALSRTRRASLHTVAEMPSRRIEHRMAPANTRSTFHPNRSDLPKEGCAPHSPEQPSHLPPPPLVGWGAFFSEQTSLAQANPMVANP